jgi:hypothetical protein
VHTLEQVAAGATLGVALYFISAALVEKKGFRMANEIGRQGSTKKRHVLENG